MSENTVLGALRRRQYDRWNDRAWLFVDGLNSTKWTRLESRRYQRQLAHAERNNIRAATAMPNISWAPEDDAGWANYLTEY